MRDLNNLNREHDDTLRKRPRKKKKQNYKHKVLQIGWFRFSYFCLNQKFTIRIELSKGWE
jgi:hypothetical protein